MIKFLPKKLVKSFGLLAFAGLATTSVAQTFNWSPAGPIYTAGRARNMLVDKTDPSGNTLYVGSTTSGIFKSTDGGVNWAPLDDQGTVRNISYMTQDANGTIFVATGEGFLRPSQAAKALPGTGLYKLNGNALTLVCSAATTGTAINRVACHPSNDQIMAIATNSGVLVSTDAGNTFALANTGTYTPTPNLHYGQDVKFDNNGVLYFSIGNETSKTIPVNTATVFSTVWKSNGGVTSTTTPFNNITPTNPAVPTQNYGRIELAIAPSNQNVIYASVSRKYTGVRNSPTTQGFFASYDGGNSWGLILVGSAQQDPLFSGSSVASGDYAHCVTVSPFNANEVYVGGYYMYVYYRTGGSDANPVGYWIKLGSPSFINTQLYLHENIHDIKLIPGSGSISKYYVVTDAGIYRSVDNCNSFQPFYKGLVTGQFNSVSIDKFPGTSPTTPSTSASGTTVTPFQTYIGGTGGNGLTYFNGNYPLVTQESILESGDVFNAEYSKILPKAAYFTLGSGALYRASDVQVGNSAQVDLVTNAKNQTINSFANSSYSLSGTPFKLWENYGKSAATPDSLIFFNDTARAVSAVTSLSAQTSFSFTVGRPYPNALIDKVVIRAGLVTIASTPSVVSTPQYSVLNTKTVTIQLSPTYTNSTTQQFTPAVSYVQGYTASPAPMVVMSPTNNLDQIFVNLAAPLFTSNPTTSPAVADSIKRNYFQVRATVYYKYLPSEVVKIVDNSISTISSTLSLQLPADTVRWGKSTQTLYRVATTKSARLATAYGNAVYVSTAPLDLNSPMSLVMVSKNLALTEDAMGNSTSTVGLNIPGLPTVLEWSKSGTELYYATDANKLYRVNHLHSLVDSTAKNYSGKFHTNIFTYSNTPAPPTYTATSMNTPNPRCPFRTTCIGTFSKKITSISVAPNDTMVVITLDDPTGVQVMASTRSTKKYDETIVNFTAKNGSLTNLKTYCSLVEKSDSKKVFVGTDNGIYYTNDITMASPTWSNIGNNQLPNVQIFDIKQQTIDPWDCYNSGQIFVATNGRGIWTNNNFYSPTVVNVKEILSSTKENNLVIYPNPTNGDVNIIFTGISGETSQVSVLDINGRVVKTDVLGKLNAGEVNYHMDTNTLPTGVYIVNITSDSGAKRVAKLIVTK